jgi:agmatine deiminase
MERCTDNFKKTPRELGFRMPAEWEKHDAVWIAWPHDPTTVPDRVEKVEQTYVEIVKAIHASEQVNLFVRDGAMKKKAKGLFEQSGVDLEKICFHEFDYADVWFRDYGPIFVLNKERQLAIVHWIFNSWGEKYQNLLKDAQMPDVINKKIHLPRFEPCMVLEGGSIDVNGKGTLLTTEQCLLNRNRNPQLTKQEIEMRLQEYLNVSQIIWLKEGIAGDDTDGHIDDIARFVNPATVVCAYEEDKSDWNHSILKENYDILQNAVDQNGNKLKVVKLPTPGEVVGEIDNEEIRLPASYANFYIGNEVILVPVFDHKNDDRALSVLREVFPGRKVHGINCCNLAHGLGTIHCITQQQPSPRL